MYCVKNITDNLFWIGANDRRLSLFEGVYSVPKGVSYNSYFINDEKTVIFDTVDKAVSEQFFENLEYVLKGKNLDYIVVQHMEPDHSATLKQLIQLYPNITIVCNQKIQTMISQFFEFKNEVKYQIVKEGDILNTGKHSFQFVMAPMVHWPEVMVTYDIKDKILFSADAFGTFGSLNGAIFADEVDFEHEYMDEARRYYCNIVGKYGTQVQALLKKASGLEINYICPLHGFVWRNGLNDFINKYNLWSTYTPEEQGVMIAYASIYGHTANVADIIASRLRERNIKTVVFDVSVTPVSEIIANAFKWSHFVFASPTYNAGIFISMEDLLRDLVAHNIQKRTIGFVENGSWAATSGKLMKELFANSKDINFLEKSLSLKSSIKSSQDNEIDEFVNEIVSTFKKPNEELVNEITNNDIEPNTFFKLSYGLFVLTTKNENKDNGCIINTAQLLTDNPKKITISVNKQNYTHDMILKSKEFNISVLTEKANFKIFEKYGFCSGREIDKFVDTDNLVRSKNGIYYINDCTNSYISAKVEKIIDCGTHSLFVAEVTEAKTLNQEKSVTYDYYFEHIKPKKAINQAQKAGYVCKICGYFYEGENIPQDFICPLCKHGVSDFEFVK